MGSPAASPSPDAWTPPQEFDEYRLVRAIGRGRTGRVFLAHDTLLERPVAVKFIPALGPNALARFLVEARAAARIQHPNVVTLYRVGQLEEQPYLVSEFIRGMSLDRLPKPQPWERVLSMGRDLARGLSAAHRRGVLHRDIKPGNAVLTEAGEVKLLDFGLAKLLDRAAGAGDSAPPACGTPPPELPPDLDPEASPNLGARSLDGVFLPSLPRGSLVGTPYYMSPEAWAGEALTARSDVYSLGVVLYELCAGKGPFRDVPWRELPAQVRHRDASPLAQVVSGVDAGLAAVIDKCLRREPSERYATASQLLDALDALTRDDTVQAVPEGNPYRGLQAFEAEHRAVFFGRRREQRAVLERMRSEPFLLITGDSGVGKSSLCLAGLLPAVTEGGLEDGRRWRSVRLVPGRRPLAALVAALAPVLETEEETLAETLRAEPTSLVRRLRVKLGAQEGLLVYVDQLEELVTLAPPAEAELAGQALGALAEGASGVRLLATGRSDFLTRLSAVPGLGAEVPRALYLLRALSPEETRDAVTGPARVKGVRFESDALVDALVTSTLSAAEGGLPVLQFALAEMWDARDAAAGVMTQAVLDSLGGVEGALARHADAAVARLLPDQRVAARGVLLRLVTVDGTRARKTDRELVGDDARYRAALEALVHARLLVAREAQEGTSYELAHEALLSGWGTLARWLAEASERREVQSRLEAAAAHWEKLGFPSESLWGPRQLEETQVLDTGELTRRERDFLKASRRTMVRSRRTRHALVVGFVVSLGLVYGGLKLRERWSLDRQVREELGQAAQALSAVRQDWGTLRAERDEAFRLYGTGRRADADRHWNRAGAQAGQLRGRFDEVAGRLERALALAPGRADVREALADFLYERALWAEQDEDTAALPALLQRLRLYDTAGTRWRRWNAAASLTLETPVSGAEVELRPLTRDAQGRFQLGEPLQADPGRWLDAAVAPGTYQISARSLGYEPVVQWVLLRRGESRRLGVPLPRMGSVPEGFVFVPPGEVKFGSAAEASVREFFNAVPLHPVEVPAFLMARHEVTYAEWLAYVESLPPAQRAQRLPRVGTGGYAGLLTLGQVDGVWRLRFQPGNEPYMARAGAPLRYAHRTSRAEQDWLRFPVSGITFADADAYAAWLSESGRVPGARLCSELEWERAARGVDGREYPHGDTLGPDDANIDTTYGKQPGGFGPDEVGSHPASRSPFGVDDMSGNVWEWTRSWLEPGKAVARGGSFAFAATSARASNRELPEPSLRDVTVGMRVCADVAANAHP
ncbi:putative serine/threonine protein kinase [Myxococcus xanthus DK 1622]|uniref:Serine/threonine protein kinase n=3 Tax=Myxococcus xanthus TaxID=34 RepID=Q1DEX9_MYXXD|nr:MULTISPECIES: SUMF1/EgtB/PvdO family nonheme iron enzyme [Myxococcus]ABF92323.1 putative serine/threonine protein kinase [Myxococcus xanthus DK 1622]NOJ56454.1 SUMF1/EgtB/PvdO family nonheme iron enzyme [Myxococcus xanthus]QPM80222.1 SUMF1/EgtB/PvdO family nonheme iron enzyme [Myxococcus xanthus]QVW69286.1 SUMF1/EgtB/PvdO family nonheme iron enzyme [Myxococcus xanthus DZ2]UEO04587.1 SUMF1/EgtB/PvdO family nonheme iron enzyme [Myxococcus xanthus DZ2]